MRPDHWSVGAARVATREGLQAQSFALAAESYRAAVDGSMSPDSLRRLTEGWEQVVAERRADEAQQANAPVAVGESPRTRRVAEVEPIATQARLSTDGTMVLMRTEGWKEVKIATLSQHSYQAGLWDADTFAPYQYAEGQQRGLDHCERVTSTNDGAVD